MDRFLALFGLHRIPKRQVVFNNITVHCEPDVTDFREHLKQHLDRRQRFHPEPLG